jgi:hypothetical protein
MGHVGRRRVYASASVLFAALMLVLLALIARNGVIGVTSRATFAVQLVAWSLAVTARNWCPSTRSELDPTVAGQPASSQEREPMGQLESLRGLSALGDCLSFYLGNTVACIGDGGHRTARFRGLTETCCNSASAGRRVCTVW